MNRALVLLLVAVIPFRALAEDGRIVGGPTGAEGRLALVRTYRALAPDAGAALPPGALYLDPRFTGDGPLDFGGAVPAAGAVQPVPMKEALFPRGRPLSLTGADGTVVTVKTWDEYQQAVARHRAAAKLPIAKGTPIAVQLNLQGGGGGGKRYPAALAELYANGVVPTSVTGVSAGAIAAAMIAAGADPKQFEEIVNDEALSKLFDPGLRPAIGFKSGSLMTSTGMEGGALAGRAAYDFVDAKLRQLTGISGRPVVFADLRTPLYIIASRISDSAPQGLDLTTVKGRTFVFSQQTTPVALAVRASIAIPGLFAPVVVVDPSNGREIGLMDGGLIDNLPMGYARNGLPELGLSLLLQASVHAGYTKPAKPLPASLPAPDEASVPENARIGQALSDESGRMVDDHRDRTAPDANEFVLALPMWNLAAPAQRNEVTVFARDPVVDLALDLQTRRVTRAFLAGALGKLGTPGASATNLAPLPKGKLQFQRSLVHQGVTWDVVYRGTDALRIVPRESGARPEPCEEPGCVESGTGSRELRLGKTVIEALYVDGQSFGSFDEALQYAIELYERGQTTRLRDDVLDSLRIEKWAGFDPVLRTP